MCRAIISSSLVGITQADTLLPRAEIRHRICEASAWLGIDLDPQANLRRGPCISRPRSRVQAWVIPTNEELVIARHTGRLLGLIDAHA